jgi:hypothetical protein
MRLVGTIVLLGLVALPIEAARRPRFVRCCLELAVPEVPGPVCAQVRGWHGLRPRRACRLLGGRPIGRGDCNPALCRREPA